MIDEIISTLVQVVGPATLETLYMTLSCMIYGGIIGFGIAIILYITGNNGMYPNRIIYAIIDFIVNTFRSFPFIILIVAMIPITRMIIGTSIGTKAAIVPLTIAMAPFIARIFENAFQEVDLEVIEAGRSFGMTNRQVLFHIVMVESFPAVVSGFVLATITAMGGTAMAGAVGAKGLGSVALMYGYQSYNDLIMYMTVILLIMIAQLSQSFGNWIYKKIK
ncbi:MAG: methionine ABC transporter permease [Lachnospiraceae bacterium]